MITTYTLTLVYKDGTTWFAGGFTSMDALNAWLAAEQSRPYWDAATTTSIDTITSTLQDA